jgi:hypothetical protein
MWIKKFKRVVYFIDDGFLKVKPNSSIVVYEDTNDDKKEEKVEEDFENLGLDLTNHVLNGEFVQLLHGESVLRAWSSYKVEDVLVLLELGGKIARDLAVLFKG